MKIFTQMSQCLYLLALMLATSKVEGEEQHLVNFLFNKSRYDKRVLPCVGRNGPVNVIIGLTIYRIEDLVEKNEQLVTHGVLHLSWNDPNLGWKQSKFGGIGSITINPGYIWLPDIVLYNSANEQLNSRRIGRIRPTIHYDGNVTLDSPVLLHTICSVDVEDYPIDKQQCDFVFGSWAHHSEQISVTSKPEKFDLRRYIVNGQWEITGTTFKQHLLFYGGNANYGFYDVTFKITLQRRVLYYAMYLIIPASIIALLSSVIFVLPQDCSERITVGMAVLVALSFFFLLVSETTPASSKVSIIEGYYSVTMIEMTLSFFLNVLVLRFHHATEEKVPSWVKIYILNYGARLLRMTFRANNQLLQSMKKRRSRLTGKSKLCTIVNDKMERFSLKTLTGDKVIADVIETQIKMSEREAEWKKAAEILNNYSLILHILVVLLTFFVVFFQALSL